MLTVLLSGLTVCGAESYSSEGNSKKLMVLYQAERGLGDNLREVNSYRSDDILSLYYIYNMRCNMHRNLRHRTSILMLPSGRWTAALS